MADDQVKKLKYLFENFDKAVLAVTTFLFLVGFGCLIAFLSRLGVGLSFDLSFLPVYGAVSVFISLTTVMSFLIPYFIIISRQFIPSFRIGRFYDASWRFLGCVFIPLFFWSIGMYGVIGLGAMCALLVFSQILYVIIIVRKFRGEYPWASSKQFLHASVLLFFFLSTSILIGFFFSINLIYLADFAIGRGIGNEDALYFYLLYSFLFLIALYFPIAVTRGRSDSSNFLLLVGLFFFSSLIFWPDFLGRNALRVIGTGGGIVVNYGLKYDSRADAPLMARKVFCDNAKECNFVISRKVCLWFSAGENFYISELHGVDLRGRFCNGPLGKVFPIQSSFIVKY